MSIVLDKNTFDPNLIFGDPFASQFLKPENINTENSVFTEYSSTEISQYPCGVVRLLSVSLISQGHDSERLTSSVEVRPSVRVMSCHTLCHVMCHVMCVSIPIYK